ncbi:MAG: YihY/virulence factor BrkB family protein [Pseudohongiellaceae bacterium]
MNSTLHRVSDLRDKTRHSVHQFLWHTDDQSAPLWKRVLKRALQICYAIGRDLMEGQLQLRAMSLVFSTIIGFMPLIALVFSVLKGLGVHNAMEPTLQALLEPLGDRSEQVTDDIINFVDQIQVELLGIFSIGLLLYIVLDMMLKVETSFNYIWSVQRSRSWTSRLSEYLFAVIVSPLLLFLSISISSYVNTNFFQRILEDLSYGAIVLEFFGMISPILFMSLAFAFAYSFLPNTRVNFISAFIGGLVTTLIWKMMGAFFQEVFLSTSRQSIYLAFASIIATVFFIYIGWLVALIGSSIAYYHQFPSRTRTGRQPVVLSISQQEDLVLALATLISKRFHDRQAPLSINGLADTLDLPVQTIEEPMRILLQVGLLTETGDDPPRYVPRTSISDCTFVEIWRALREYHPALLTENTNLPSLERVREFRHRLDAVVNRELGKEKLVDEPNYTPGT